jgi:hypothetical protein
MLQNNIKVDVDTIMSTPMITAARKGATAFSHTRQGLVFFMPYSFGGHVVD